MGRRVVCFGSPVAQEQREAGPARCGREAAGPGAVGPELRAVGWVSIRTSRPGGMWVVGLGCSAPGSGYGISHGGVGACHVCIADSTCGVCGCLCGVVLRP